MGTCFNFLAVSDAYCLASTVSSRLLQAIAVKEGVNYVVSGLPWIDVVTSSVSVHFQMLSSW